MHKNWTGYAAAVGISRATLEAHPLTPLAGWFECGLGLLVLAWPTRGLLLFIVASKVATEALRPLAGEPIWEFIERGGSYGAPLALAWIQSWRRTATASPRGATDAFPSPLASPGSARRPGHDGGHTV